MSNWLDDLTGAQIQIAGVNVPQRKNMNFLAGVTASDNPATGSTDLTVPGTSSSYVTAVTAKTANYAILAADIGVTFTNVGAGGSVIFTLPASVVGYEFKFSVEVAHNFEILAIGSDVIRFGGSISAAAGNVLSAAIGSTVNLKCTAAGVWSAMGGVSGTWTVN